MRITANKAIQDRSVMTGTNARDDAEGTQTRVSDREKREAERARRLRENLARRKQRQRALADTCADAPPPDPREPGSGD